MVALGKDLRRRKRNPGRFGKAGTAVMEKNQDELGKEETPEEEVSQ